MKQGKIIRMGKQSSVDTRKITIYLHKKSKSLQEIGEIVGRNNQTVSKMIDKIIKYQTMENLLGVGRSKCLTAAEIRWGWL